MMEERLRSHYESLARVIGWTRVADAKAAPILALHSALLGISAARTEAIRTVFDDGSPLIGWLLAGLLAIFAVGVIAAFVSAARVYMPQTTGGGGSLIYFGSVADMTADEFVAQAKQLDADKIEHGLLEQVHIVSLIGSRKMARVRRAFIASAPALVAWVGVIAITA